MLRARMMAVLAMLGGCSQVSAASFDATDDVHCYALSVYFTASATKDLERGEGSPEENVSTLVLGAWFADKWSEVGNPELENEVVKPLFAAVGDDFEETKSRYKQCVNRARTDPAFERFALDYLNELQSLANL